MKKLFLSFLFFIFSLLIFAQEDLSYLTESNDLFKAVFNNQLEKVKEILNKNPQRIHEKVTHQKNLLFFVRDIKIAQYLVQQGIDIQAKDEFENTPLHFAYNTKIAEFFLEKGININVLSRENRNPLMEIVGFHARKDSVAIFLIEKGIDLSVKDNQQKNAFHLAFSKYNSYVSEHLLNLLQKNININEVDSFGNTPIFYAIQSLNSANILKKMIAYKADLEVENNEGKTPLLYAIQHYYNYEAAETLLKGGTNIENHPKEKELFSYFLSADFERVNYQKYNVSEILNLLLKQTKDIEFKDENERTPLLLALSSQIDYSKFVLKLLERGANIHAKDKNGKTALLLACKSIKPQKEIIEILLKKGANINEKDNNENTPFTMALLSGNKEIVDFLIEKGAKIDVKNNLNKTPLHYVKDVKIAETLLKKGIDINGKDIEGNTPLLSALLNNYDDLAIFFIKNGADVNVQNKLGNAPLHYISQVKTLQAILEKKPNLNIKNNQGNTPLHFADNIQIAQILIENGANLDIENNDNNTPLLMALIEQQPEISQLLIEKGAKTEVENNQGQTAESLAKENKYENIYFRLKGNQMYSKYLQTQPLWNAIKMYDVKAAQEALQKGADTTLVDMEGKTFQDILKANDFKNFQNFLNNKNNFPTFLQKQKADYFDGFQLLKGTNFLITKQYKNFTLWDIKTARKIRNFEGYYPALGEIKLTENKNFITAKHKTWNINTGIIVKNTNPELDEFEENNAGDTTQDMEFDLLTENKKYAINLGNNFNIEADKDWVEVYDYATKKKKFSIARDKNQEAEMFTSFVFSNQQKYGILTTSHRLIIFDIESNKILFQFLIDKEKVKNFVFSNDDKYLLVAKNQNENNDLICFEMDTQKIIQQLKIEKEVVAIKFSPDNQYFALLQDNICQWIDFKTFKTIQKIENLENVSPENASYISLDISENNQNLLISRNNHTTFAEIFDIKTGKKIQQLKKEGYARDYFKNLLSPNNQYVLQNFDENGLFLLDLVTEKKMIIPIKPSKNELDLVFFSNDNQYIYAKNQQDELEVWTLNNPKKIHTFSKEFTKSLYYVDVELPRNNNQKIFVANPQEFIVGDIKSGKKEAVNRLNIQEKYNATSDARVITEDGKKIIFHLSGQNKLHIWEPDNKSINVGFNNFLEPKKDIEISIQKMRLSSQDKYLLLLESTIDKIGKKRVSDMEEPFINILHILDLKNQKKLHKIVCENLVTEIQFSQDNKYFFSIHYGGIFQIWNTEKGESIHKIFIGYEVDKLKIKNIDKQDKWIALEGKTDIRVFDIITGKEIYGVYFQNDRENFTFLSQEGWYYTNQNPQNIPFHFTNGTQILTFEQFELQFERKDKMLEILKIGNKKNIDEAYKKYLQKLNQKGFKLEDLEKERFFNAPEIQLRNINQTYIQTNQNKYLLEIEGYDKIYKIIGVQIVVNDKNIFDEKGKKPQKPSTKIQETLEIPLQKGTNQIKIYIWNEKGIKSYHQSLQIEMQ
jgi:cytohesin